MPSSSKKIRGITIEMSADANGVVSAIRDVDKAASNTQKQLRDVEKLLKFDPDNTELLAQKQRLLAEAAEQAQQKEKLLDQAMEDLDKQLNQGKLSQQQYNEQHDALQRELIETDRKLDGYQSSLKEISDTTKDAENQTEKLGETAVSVADEMEAVFDGVEKVGSGLTVGLTAPIVALGTAGTKTYLDLDSAATKMINQTGKATEETEKYRDILEEIYKGGYGENYEDIADSMATVRQNLGEMDDLNLRKLTEDALLVRDTFEYDVSESTRAAKAMMDNFGVSAKDAFSYIITGAQNGLDYSGELLDSISEYSVQFAKVGFDADDMFNIFQEGYETGSWNLDKMGDAVKELSIRVVDGSETTAEGFQTIGLNADEMSAKFAAGGESAKQAFEETITALAETEDPLAQNTAGVDLFGTMWEDLGPEVVTQLANISDGTYDAEGAMDALNDSMSDAQKAEQNMREAQEALSDIGESLVEIGLPALESLSGILGDVADWFDSLDDNGKNVVLTLAGIAAAAGPVVKVVGSVGNGILSLKQKLDSFKSSADTAKQSVSNLNTSATNAAGSSGGISKLGSTLGTVFSGVGIVAAGIGLISGIVQGIQDMNDAATNANFSHFSDQWSTINTTLQNAKSNLDDYNDVVLNSNEKLAGIEEDLRQVQSDITTICDTASSQRRDLTQSEIDTLNQLFQKEQELTTQQLQQYQQVVSVAATSAQMDLQRAANMNTEQFNAALSENYTTMMDAYQQVADAQDSWLATREAELYSYYEGIGQLNSTEHQQAVQEARNQAEQQKQIAQQQVADMLSQWLGCYEDKYNLDDLYYQQTESYNTSLQEEWSRHLAQLDNLKTQYAGQDAALNQKIQEENDYFAGRLSNIYQDLTAGMDEEEQAAFDTYMRWASDTAVWGGETSTEAQRMVQTIISAMDKLPEETQTAMEESFNGAGQTIQERAPGFIQSCIGTFTGWVDDVFNLLEVNSPSRVMRQLFGYVMDGAQIGFEDRADDMLKEAVDFASDFTDAMTPKAPSLQSIVEMRDAAESETKQMEWAITEVMGQIPSGAEKVVQESMKSAGREIQKESGSFAEDCIVAFTGWTDEAIRLLRANSTAQAMQQAFSSMMGSAEIGLEDGKEELLASAKDLSESLTDAVNPQTISIQNAAALSRMQAIQSRSQNQSASQQTQFSITVRIDRFENRTDQDINTLAQRIMTESETIYRRRAAAYGTGY